MTSLETEEPNLRSVFLRFDQAERCGLIGYVLRCWPCNANVTNSAQTH